MRPHPNIKSCNKDGHLPNKEPLPLLISSFTLMLGEKVLVVCYFWISLSLILSRVSHHVSVRSVVLPAAGWRRVRHDYVSSSLPLTLTWCLSSPVTLTGWWSCRRRRPLTHSSVMTVSHSRALIIVLVVDLTSIKLMIRCTCMGAV